MKKILTLLSLAGLLGFAVATMPQRATADNQNGSATSQSLPQGKLVQADVKLATLRAKIVYDGPAPKPQKVAGNDKDAFCSALNIVYDRLIVGDEGELKNLVFYLYDRSGDVVIPDQFKKAPDAVHELDNRNCMFAPHILVARPGQTIKVLNSDQTGHNANFSFFENQPVNFLVPVGGEKSIDLKFAEPAPIPVECNVHPWMKAHVIVLDHPYVGVSDENGVLEIENLPPGEITFKVWHESQASAIDEAVVDGEQEKWRRGRIELELKPGMNDLGVIKISPDMFEQP